MPLSVALGYTLWWAVGCDLILEASLRVNDASRVGSLDMNSSIVVGVVIMWLTVLLLFGLTGRLRVAMAATLSLSLLLAAANAAKLRFLNQPLAPADAAFLRNSDFLVTMVSWTDIALAAAVIICSVAVVFWLGSRLGSRFAHAHRGDPNWRRHLVGRAVLVLVCGGLLSHAYSFNQPGNLWRMAYRAVGADWVHWNQLHNSQFNGFVAGALYNLPTVAMERPEGYSKEAMTNISARYATEPETSGAEPRGPVGKTNVVIVLSESFADPQRLDGVQLDEDPLAHSREVMSRTWAGDLLTSFVGTGTSAMEFQVLSGQSLALFQPQVTTPYQQFVPSMDSYPTAVGWLEAQGHKTVAIHPYSTEMYNRPEVYSIFGFDEFVHDTTMQSSERVESNLFISDRSAYNEVIHQVEKSAAPVLAHLVTMQNHVPTGDWYEDPIRVTGAEGREAVEIGGWARGLSHTDSALAEFLGQLQDTGEPTTLLFFGDHFPGIFGEKVLTANPELALLRTPFFLWSTEGGAANALGITSPTALLPLAMEHLGAQLPPYFRLLLEVESEIGSLRGDSIITPDGDEIGYGELDARQRALLHDLRMVQYDFSIGGRYALKNMWY